MNALLALAGVVAAAYVAGARRAVREAAGLARSAGSWDASDRSLI